MTEAEAIQTGTELEKAENLVPVLSVENRTIVSLFRNYYPEETLQHLQINPEKVIPLMNALKSTSKSIIRVSGPILCLGPKCPSADRCPIQRAGVAPISHSCPVELMLIDMWEEEYISDLGVDKQSKLEIDMVRDLIESDLIDWRTSNEIAKNGLYDWNAVGMSDTGKPIFRKEENVAIGIKLKFKTRKDKIREDFMGTRKIRAKFGMAKTMDPSKFASQLQKRYEKIRGEAVPAETQEISQEMTPEKDKNA